MEYKTIRLSDFATINMGQSPKSEYYNYDGDGLPFLQGNRTFGRLFPVFDTYTTAPTKIAEQGDIIMSVRAPVGDLNIAPTKLCLGRGVCSLKAKNANQTFLVYLMKHYVKQLIHKESGTVFGSVNRNDIANLEVSIPEESVQHKIATVLSSFDTKIELNTAINNNLEQQAQALITNYVSKTPGVTSIGNLLSFVNGFAFKSGDYLAKGLYKIITIKNVQDGLVDSQGAAGMDDLPVKLPSDCKLNIGDVLLSLTGNVGRVGIVTENNLLLNQRVAKVKPKNDELLPFIYFVLRLPAMKTEMENISKGTAQQNLSPIETLKLQLNFEESTAVELSHTLFSMFNQIVHNMTENRHLSEIRDTLLPKLMSGEIDVSKVDISDPSCLDKSLFNCVEG